MDVVIPMAFPDYLIAVNTPPTQVPVPDLIPYFDILPDTIQIRATSNKVPYLGHAGVMFFDGTSGLSKYYEYGRYDRAALGLTRRVPISDVKIGADKKPTMDSLKKALLTISSKAGQGGRIQGAYIELPAGSFAKMLQYALSRVRLNKDPKRAPYTLTGNSCMHFAKLVAEAGGAKIPMIIDPRPISFIEAVQAIYPKLSFKPPGSLTMGS